MNDPIKQINSILETNSICKRCCLRILNANVRQFDKYDEYLPDEINVEGLVVESKCKNCFGLVASLITLSETLLTRLKQLEFESFLIGTMLTKEYKQIDKLLEEIGVPTYLIKQEVIRVYHQIITQEIDVQLRHDFPEVTILFEIRGRPRFQLDIRSLYILGKYRKYTRGIPQTKWPCTFCKGKKCEKCNYTGQQYPKSVESLVSAPFISASEALGSSFHGAGREDIDALMLGEGRPFVLELKQPRIRTLNLELLTEEVNQSSDVNIQLMRYCTKETVEDLKKESQFSRKSYRALIQIENPVSDEIVRNLKLLEFPLEIKQRTPQRVSHRRADKIRNKTIFNVEIGKLDGNQLELIIEAQGGAYIKEFISGDDGRSNPSISEVLQQSALCIELDVQKVDDKGLFEA